MAVSFPTLSVHAHRLPSPQKILWINLNGIVTGEVEDALHKATVIEDISVMPFSVKISMVTIDFVELQDRGIYKEIHFKSHRAKHDVLLIFFNFYLSAPLLLYVNSLSCLRSIFVFSHIVWFYFGSFSLYCKWERFFCFV